MRSGGAVPMAATSSARTTKARFPFAIFGTASPEPSPRSNPMTMKGDPREIVARMRHHDNCTAPADRDDECGCLLSNLRAAMTTNSTDAPDMRAVLVLIDAVSEWADDPSP